MVDPALDRMLVHFQGQDIKINLSKKIPLKSTEKFTDKCTQENRESKEIDCMLFKAALFSIQFNSSHLISQTFFLVSF